MTFSFFSKPKDEKKLSSSSAYDVVHWDAEFERIANLKRRSLPNVDMTLEFRRPGGSLNLWPLQSVCLYEMSLEGGLLACVSVGGGKTGIGLLAGRAMSARRTVYLLPAQLKKQVRDVNYPFWNEHFYVPELDEELFLVAYEELSSAKNADVLTRIRPNLVVADEAHKLKRSEAARTKRFLRYMRHSGCDLVAMSGTMTTRSLHDYAHLADLTLRRTSPVPSPRAYRTLVEWAEALDAPKKGETPRRPGILCEFMTEGELAEMAKGEVDAQVFARAGFRRRLVETQGVVASEEGALGTTLIVRSLDLEMPENVKDVLRTFYKTWKIGDEEIEEAPRFWSIARQLAMGFYYEWKWPNGVKDVEWLEARAAWHAEVRDYLHHRAKPGFDSPFLLAQAAIRGDWKSTAWADWARVKDRKPPPTVPIWIDEFLVDDVERRLQAAEKPMLVWYEHKAIGAKLAARGWNVPEPGSSIPERPAKVETLVLSIASFSTGRNLQFAWSENLVTCPPASGTVWEQMIGRTHRPGQEEDEVLFDVYGHTQALKEALGQAYRDAQYQQGTTGQQQKLLFANRVNW